MNQNIISISLSILIYVLTPLLIFAQPDVKLHVEGSLQLDKVGPALGRLILNTVSPEDPGRYGILFSNNTVAAFLGEDINDQSFNFYSKWGNNRTYDAILRIHGKATNSWGHALMLTHDGSSGKITTDIGNLILDPTNSNVGINISDPQTKLHVAGDKLRLSSVADMNRFLQFRTDGTALDIDAIGAPLYIQAGNFIAMGLGVTNVGIGTNNPGYKLQVGEMGDGSEARANAWNTLSDKRWKRNIVRLEDPISKLQQISGYYYFWKEGVDQRRQIGVLAQEIEDVLPEIVSTDKDGYKSVEYGKLSALLIETIKDQQKMIERQEQNYIKLEQELLALKNQTFKSSVESNN